MRSVGTDPILRQFPREPGQEKVKHPRVERTGQFVRPAEFRWFDPDESRVGSRVTTDEVAPGGSQDAICPTASHLRVTFPVRAIHRFAAPIPQIMDEDAEQLTPVRPPLGDSPPSPEDKHRVKGKLMHPKQNRFGAASHQ
jgi:hypothetical protein